jgi:hypothetical protein
VLSTATIAAPASGALGRRRVRGELAAAGTPPAGSRSTAPGEISGAREGVRIARAYPHRQARRRERDRLANSSPPAVGDAALATVDRKAPGVPRSSSGSPQMLLAWRGRPRIGVDPATAGKSALAASEAGRRASG